jgi:hypothetical protein
MAKLSAISRKKNAGRYNGKRRLERLAQWPRDAVGGKNYRLCGILVGHEQCDHRNSHLVSEYQRALRRLEVDKAIEVYIMERAGFEYELETEALT